MGAEKGMGSSSSSVQPEIRYCFGLKWEDFGPKFNPSYPASRGYVQYWMGHDENGDKVVEWWENYDHTLYAFALTKQSHMGVALYKCETFEEQCALAIAMTRMPE